MRSTIASAAEGNLDDPALGTPFGRVKEQCLLVERKEHLLDDLLGFTLVVQNAESDSENQP